MKVDVGAAAVSLLSVGAWLRTMEPGAFFMVASALSVLLVGCWITYKFAIREAQRQIEVAFAEHSQTMHENTQALLEKVVSDVEAP